MDLRDDPKTVESMRGKPISFDDGLQLANELSRDLGQRVLCVVSRGFSNLSDSWSALPTLDKDFLKYFRKQSNKLLPLLRQRKTLL